MPDMLCRCLEGEHEDSGTQRPGSKLFLRSTESRLTALAIADASRENDMKQRDYARAHQQPDANAEAETVRRPTTGTTRNIEAIGTGLSASA